MTNIISIEGKYPTCLIFHLSLLQNCNNNECGIHVMIEWAKLVEFCNNFYNFGSVTSDEILVSPMKPNVYICEQCRNIVDHCISSES